MAGSNVATLAFIWENVIMIDSLEIIASCDMEFDMYSKLNDKIKDYEYSRSRSRFPQHF